MSELKKIWRIQKPQRKHWVGDGFHVYSMFSPTKELLPHISPFLLMDVAPPEYFDPSKNKRGVGEHPHRGFETVTFVYSGEIEHKDSAGGGGLIKPGDVQWMTAGSGLVHEEMHSSNMTENGGEFGMVQLWVNLPMENEMSPPKYQGISEGSFPKATIGENEILKVIAGEFGGLNGPCETHSEINIFELDLQSNSSHSLSLPEETNTLLLMLNGSCEINKTLISENELVIFESLGEGIEINSKSNSKILVLNGKPLDEPVHAYGPFVLSSEEKLRQAFADYQEGKMGRLSGQS